MDQPFQSRYWSKKFKLPLKNNSDCNSSGVIYIIKCKKCKCFYIGESSRTITTRIKEHLYSINSFIPYSKHTPVSCHFNLPSHNKDKDFLFTIYQSNIANNFERRLVERKLIMQLLFHNINLINIDTSSSIYLNNFNILLW